MTIYQNSVLNRNGFVSELVHHVGPVRRCRLFHDIRLEIENKKKILIQMMENLRKSKHLKLQNHAETYKEIPRKL